MGKKSKKANKNIVTQTSPKSPIAKKTQQVDTKKSIDDLFSQHKKKKIEEAIIEQKKGNKEKTELPNTKNKKTKKQTKTTLTTKKQEDDEFFDTRGTKAGLCLSSHQNYL